MFERFLGLCTGRVGQVLNISSLANDTGITHTTASQWLTLLQASYIVYLLKPYHGNFKRRLIKSPKLYFYDTGLASRLLEIERTKHVVHHPLRGNLFENLVVGELLKYRYNRSLSDPLYFYRDSKGNKVDIIQEIGGMPFPVEIKAGSTLNSEYFANLRNFVTQIAQPNTRVCLFMLATTSRRDHRFKLPILQSCRRPSHPWKNPVKIRVRETELDKKWTAGARRRLEKLQNGYVDHSYTISYWDTGNQKK